MEKITFWLLSIVITTICSSSQAQTLTATIVDSTTLPLNVMCMPNLPDFETLARLGVRRISMGNFVFDKMYKDFEQTVQTVLNQNSFKSLF